MHIVAAGVLGTYIYSPWHTVPAFDIGVQFMLIPVLILAGLAMWKQAALRRDAHGWRQTDAAPSSSERKL